MGPEKMVVDRVRSRTLHKLVSEIKIEHMKQGKRPPSCESIVKQIMKKYKIKKEDILYDRLIKF